MRPLSDGDAPVRPASVALRSRRGFGGVAFSALSEVPCFGSTRRASGEASGGSDGNEVKEGSRIVVWVVVLDEPDRLFLGLVRIVFCFWLLAEVLDVWDDDRLGRSLSSAMAYQELQTA